MNSLVKLFTTPDFEDESEYQRASMLGIVINVYLAIAFFTGVLWWLIPVRSRAFGIVALVTCMPVLGLRILVSLRQLNLGTTIFTIMLAVVNPLAAFLFNRSVGSVSTTAFELLALTICSLILKERARIVVVLFMIASNIGLLYAEAHGLYATTFTRNLFAVGVAQVGVFIAVAILISISNRRLYASGERARRELQERQRAESELSLIAQRLTLATQSAKIGIWDLDLLKNKLVWDDRMCALYGISAGDFSGEPSAWEKGIHPEDLAAVRSDFREAIDGKKEFHTQFRVIWPDGEIRHIEGHAAVRRNADGQAVRMTGINWDTTEQKRIEGMVRESEGRFRALFENAPESIVVLDCDKGTFVDANENAAQLFKSDLAHLLSVGPVDLSPLVQPSGKPSTELAMAQVQRALEGEQVEFEWMHRTVTGEDIPCEVRLVRLPSATRRLVRGSITNVTARVEAEAALRKSEERYRDIFDNANDIIYAHDLQGNYTSMNKTAERLIGYSLGEVMGMSVRQIVSPDDFESARESTRRKLAGEVTRTLYETEVICKDGRRLQLEVSSHLIYENGKPIGVQGIARDISERKNLEEQLRQSQKMESIGRLAGGIAHDFNNLLTAILGYSRLVLDRLQPSDPHRAQISEIEKAGTRAADLTSQLLAFSRRQVLQAKVLDLNLVIRDMENLLRRIIGEDIELEVMLDSELGNIKADPGQLQQVVMNLAVNARDAMPEGGRFTIATSNVEITSAEVEPHLDLMAGSYVMLTVSDTGTGMDQEIQQRIFEPFFTTKEQGKGTGLGLATVYGITKQSGGDIVFESAPDWGTTFRIYLPRVPEPAESKLSELRTKDPRKGHETILLVEDEEVVRSLVHELLTICGYTVLEAPDPIEAIRISEKFEGTLELMLTDVVMPRMSGPELVNRLAPSRPNMKVVFMSGYTDSASFGRDMVEAGHPFLPKPFTIDVLKKTIRSVLDGE